MNEEPDIPSYAEGLRERLRFLLQGVPQRELARRLGVPNQSFNRYLHGTMPPAWMCTHIVRTLDVNPAWLLTGEGAPYLADINTGARQTAGDLLELVQAMNSVAKMRLGALSGKQHLKVLRELNDAFVQMDELRGKLNTGTLPVFKQIYKDLWKAVEENDLDRAASLVNAGDQVSRVCDDVECRRGFAYLKSAYLYKLGNIDGFVRQLHETIRLYATQGEHPDNAGWRRIGSYMTPLFRAWRQRQARSLCDAYLGLSHDADAATPAIDYLTSWSGYFDLEDGKLDMARLKIGGAFHRSQSWDRSNPDSLPTNIERVLQVIKLHSWKMMYCSGTVVVNDIPLDAFDSFSRAAHLAGVAMWERDAGFLRRFVESLEQSDASNAENSTPSFQAFRAVVLEQLARIRHAIESKRKGPVSTKVATKDTGQSNEVRLFVAISNAEVATPSGAGAVLAQAGDEMLHGESKLTPPLMLRAVHYRHVLEAFPRPAQSQRALVQRARKFFETHLSNGYRCFDSVRTLLDTVH